MQWIKKLLQRSRTCITRVKHADVGPDSFADHARCKALLPVFKTDYDVQMISEHKGRGLVTMRDTYPLEFAGCYNGHRVHATTGEIVIARSSITDIFLRFPQLDRTRFGVFGFLV